MKTAAILTFMFLLTAASASVTLIKPNQIHMDTGHHDYERMVIIYGDGEYTNPFYLGEVGPNQVFEVVMSRNTGEEGTAATIFWETLSINGDELSEQKSGNIVTKIQAPETPGEYIYEAKAEGIDINTIEPALFKLKIKVKNDVYSYKIDPLYSSQAGKEAKITFIVTSSSIADDTLMLSDVTGIPTSWLTYENIPMNAKETKSIAMGVTPNEEGYYTAGFSIQRVSSNVADKISFDLKVIPTLKSKLRAFGEGFSIVPILLQPFYSLLSLFGMG